MTVAEEMTVVAEHKQKITRPENHIKLHESDYARVTCHGAYRNLSFPIAEQHPLPPVDKVATVFRAEHIQHHHHNPQAESGRQNEIFGPGDYLAVYNLGLCAPTDGIVLKQKLYPPRPEEQAAEKAEQCLPCVASCKDTGHHHSQSNATNGESRYMHGRRRQRAFHYYHQCVSERHHEQH